MMDIWGYLQLLLVEMSSLDIVRYRGRVCVSWCSSCAVLLPTFQDHGNIWIELVSAFSYTRSSPSTFWIFYFNIAMNHTTLSVVFGIAFAAAPTSPGAPCVLAAFSINVGSLKIYNVYFIVTEFPIYSFSCAFQHFLRPALLSICSKPVYFYFFKSQASCTGVYQDSSSFIT